MTLTESAWGRTFNLADQLQTPRGIPRCRWCYEPIKVRQGKRGLQGKGQFCRVRCALAWAHDSIRLIDDGWLLRAEQAKIELERPNPMAPPCFKCRSVLVIDTGRKIHGKPVWRCLGV